jgi:uncharacterized protein
MFRRWRRIDQPGLELARIEIAARSVTVCSMLVDAGPTPFGLRYLWMLDKEWRTRSLRIESMANDDRWLTIERTGASTWKIDGKPAPHLDGCPELDLSATPFCNGLAIRRLGEDGEFTAAYISAEDLTVTPSRQRYEQLGPDTWRYIDLGVSDGFTAILDLDPDGLVAKYEGLFEALP